MVVRLGLTVLRLILIDSELRVTGFYSRGGTRQPARTLRVEALTRIAALQKLGSNDVPLGGKSAIGGARIRVPIGEKEVRLPGDADP
jgi:hypothetical protein